MNFREYRTSMKQTIVTTAKGLAITLRIFGKVWRRGPVTLSYPEIKDQLPLGSRGLLFNDVVDCNVCRQCAAVCPSRCIHIEAEKKKTDEPKDFIRNGVKKNYTLKKFTIDTSLCCYCGLCVSVCPDDCLFHTQDYEYSVINRDKHIYNYTDYHR